MTTPLQEQLTAVQGRVVAATEHGYATGVLDDTAALAADQLIGAAQQHGDNDTLVAAVRAVAWLYWCRHLALPGTAGDAELNVALGLFSQLVQLDPSLVPQQLVPVLTEQVRSTPTADAAPSLDGIIAMIRDALAAMPETDPDRPDYLSDLSGALRERYTRDGSLADLNDAIRASSVAVEITPAVHPRRAIRFFNLSGALHSRFIETGDPPDLDRSVDSVRQAVLVSQVGDPLLPKRNLHLREVLNTRFQQLGRSADLEAAIEAAQLAMNALPDGNSHRTAAASRHYAMAESFFATPKTEFYYGRVWPPGWREARHRGLDRGTATTAAADTPQSSRSAPSPSNCNTSTRPRQINKPHSHVTTGRGQGPPAWCRLFVAG